MKIFLQILIYSLPFLSFGQSIFSNSIDGVNPNDSNPYTFGQYVDPNISVTGIGRGTALYEVNANDRYDAKSWGFATLDSNAYFEFTIIPNTGKEIDFVSFVYTGQISPNGPIRFAFRSSVDNFTSDIGIITANGATVSLSAVPFQNITSSISFRIYGWNTTAGTGTFSINNFKFNGIISCSLPKAPVLTETSLSCSATSFNLHWEALLFSENYFIDVATDAGFLNYLLGYKDKALGNVLSETISGLSAGKTYYVRMHSMNNCGISVYSNVIEVAPPVTVYDGVWSNGTPDANKNVRFLKDFNVDNLLEACSCQIDDGVAVHVDSDAIVKLQNDLDIIGDGSLKFENNATLIQVNDKAVNTGKINYVRNTSTVENFDYVYWCSPVENQMLNLFSPNSDRYYSYETGAWVMQNGTNRMNPVGKGFIIRVPKAYTSAVQTFEFSGVPNNGEVWVDVGVVKSNLIGNPYPSAINAKVFMMDPHNSKISGGLYFWTHNTKRKLEGSQYVYTSSDYTLYNLTGGAGPAPSTNGLGVTPSGEIAAGQAFFVASSESSQFYFNNAMRISDSGSNTQFFKPSNTKKSTEIEKNRIWLNLTNDGGAFKQLLVGYITGATNDFDRLYDGVSFNGNTYIDFYSVSNLKNFTIQGRKLPFDPTDEVPLGYKTTIAGTFQISIDNSDGILMNQSVYLEDKTANSIHDLKRGAYSFTTEIGTFNDRFVLRYSDISKLGVDDNFVKERKVVISVKNSQIKINSFDEVISSIRVYDLKGGLLYNKNKVNKYEFIVEHLTSNDQLLIVTIQLENEKRVSEKIIFHD
ncbi:fibronectin type III domain-containing protein [Flavobacterium sp. 5]|uniref:fibronectin type III domain-containing protein n=1 Tax=Flavobacterium sp. 5 TaxID=2035199 RepID=UPI000C2C9A53|nr:fibronectin type III domain-containing protein [Flavobacterium sp. 5]PKB16496.1 hypothetical protein CLU82_1634 [Flavobacterium sp. 5]